MRAAQTVGTLRGVGVIQALGHVCGAPWLQHTGVSCHLAAGHDGVHVGLLATDRPDWIAW